MTATPAIARRAPRNPLRRPVAPAACYAALSAGLLILLAVIGGRGEWISDSWIHAATLTEVARHPWHPLEPLTGEAVPFAYFSPWAMPLGWIMHATGAPVWPVLTAAGLVDTGLLLTTWYRLVRALTAARWAPVLCLVLMLLLWGGGTWFWSGFPSLGTLSVGFAWPSVLAAACWFELWRTALRLDSVPRVGRLAAFGILPGLLLLVHPFTAVPAGLSVAVTLLRRVRSDTAAVVTAAVAALVSVGLAALWPWISLPAMVGDQAAFNAIHLSLYQRFGAEFALLALAVPALALRLRADRTDPLCWTAVCCALGVAFGAVTRDWSLARLMPGAALPGQLALGVLLADPARRLPRAGTPVLAGLTAVAVLVGGYANAWGVARALPGAARRAYYARILHAPQPAYPELAWITRYTRPGQVAVANFWYVRRELPTYGLRSVQTQWPSPGVPDERRRAADAARILGSTPTPQGERQRLLSVYHVRWIIWYPAAHAGQWPYPGARLVACGPDRIALLAVHPQATGRPPACPRRG